MSDWGEDMRRRLRAIEKADREGRIVDWVLYLAFAAIVVWYLWP